MTTLDAFHEEDELGAVYDRALVTWMLRYARRHAPTLVACVGLLLALTVLQLAQPYLIKLAIDRVMVPAGQSPDATTTSSLLEALWPLVAAYVGVVVLASGVQYGQAIWLRVTGQRILTEIRSDTFAHLQSLSLSYYDSRPSGRIVTRVTNDIEALGEMYTSVLVNLFRDVFFIVGAALAMIWLDWRLALAALAVLPFVMATALVFRRHSRAAYRDMRSRLARINADLAESLAGMRVIQIFGRERNSALEFDTDNGAYMAASMRMIRVFGTFGPLLSFLTSASLALVLWLGGIRVLSATLTFGTLYAFSAYLRQLYDPISALAEKYNILQAALAAAERVTELQHTLPEVRDPEPQSAGAGASSSGATLVGPAAAVDRQIPVHGSRVPESTTGVAGRTRRPAVEFDHVWFAYRDEEWVLRDVSFRVMPGETVAFVGHTGAGKSTIMNLLPRFYDVQRGAVLVDGRDVRSLRQADLRRRVGIVMQDVFLFATDVLRNISLDAAELRTSDVERAAELVGASPWIAALPGGYETPVAERGLNLSTGQRQLISVARTLAYDPDILVLDEATSSVDSETEETLQRATATLQRGRTTLVVAHRLATVRDADRIYVMQRGTIVEVGRHEDLLERGGLYRTLWRLQFDADR